MYFSIKKVDVLTDVVQNSNVCSKISNWKVLTLGWMLSVNLFDCPIVLFFTQKLGLNATFQGTYEFQNITINKQKITQLS